MSTLILTIFVALVTVSELSAKVASIEFSNLVANCELIVVAKVDSISSPLIGKKYAKARVTEVWKGTPTEQVKFLALRTWACDISEAVKGESVLLFLTRSDKSSLYSIAHSGRGRLPLRTVAGKCYATFWPDIIFPTETPTIDGPEPKWDFIRSVELDALRDLVKTAGQKTEATNFASAAETSHGTRDFALALQAIEPRISAGTTPKFRLILTNISGHTCQVLNIERRVDLRDTYFNLIVTKDGKQVSVPRAISDPGPISDVDWLQVPRGTIRTFTLTNFPDMYERLPAGTYHAYVQFWPNPFQSYTNAYKSETATFTVTK